MKKFCICTLTHNASDRGEALKYTVKTFMDSYNQSEKLDWYVLVNITNEDIDETLEWIQNEYKDRVNWNIEVSPVNTGPGGGINRLNAKIMDYEYSLFLEGDWVHVPYKYSGHSKDWLKNTISFLDSNKEVDVVQLRAYLDDLDDRQYGVAVWIKDSNVEKKVKVGKDTFVILKQREYTNPPTVRRHHSFFEKGIFPLNEYLKKDGNSHEVKGNPRWGAAEIEAAEKAKNVLVTAWLEFGNFLHFETWEPKDNWKQWVDSSCTGCKKYKTTFTGCKYGYMTPQHFFCSVCEKSETINDLEQHSNRYLQHILPLEHAEKSKKVIFKKIKEIQIDPEINIDTYIDYDAFIGQYYNRGRKQIEK